MSRIGRLPVAIPAGVTVEVAENNVVTVKGPKGTLTKELPVEMEIKVEGEEVIVTRPNDLKKMKSLHGLTRTLINNMVVGVTDGYEKVLEVNGVGYRAAKSGNKLTLNLGYSHPVEMIDPEGIETVLDGQNKITVKGIDKEKVGQFAAEIRDKRRPERSSCRPGADPRDSGDLFQTFAVRLRARDQPGIPHDLRGTPCGNRRESGGGGRTCEDGPGSLIFKYPCCP